MGIFWSYKNCPRWFFGLAWSSYGILMTLILIFSCRAVVIGMFLPRSAYNTVTGTITTAQIEMYYGRGNPSYGYRIIYTYTVGKHQYLSDAVNFNFIKSDVKPCFAQNIISTYPVGSKITVYYQTSHPSFAVLDPRIPHASIVFVSILFFILFISVIGVALAIRAKHLCPD
jgi:hypothetical protein